MPTSLGVIKGMLVFLAKKLGRILGNAVWLDSFPNAVAEFTSPDFFDHSAGVLKFEQPILKKSSFKIFNYLTKHKDFLHTVKDYWASTSVYGTHMFQLCAKLKVLKEPLRSLNHFSYGEISQRVIVARDKLLCLQLEVFTNPSDALVHAVNSHEALLVELQSVEEAFLRQKSRVKWHREEGPKYLVFSW